MAEIIGNHSKFSCIKSYNKFVSNALGGNGGRGAMPRHFPALRSPWSQLTCRTPLCVGLLSLSTYS